MTRPRTKRATANRLSAGGSGQKTPVVRPKSCGKRPTLVEGWPRRAEPAKNCLGSPATSIGAWRKSCASSRRICDSSSRPRAALLRNRGCSLSRRVRPPKALGEMPRKLAMRLLGRHCRRIRRANPRNGPRFGENGELTANPSGLRDDIGCPLLCSGRQIEQRSDDKAHPRRQQDQSRVAKFGTSPPKSA